MNLVLSTFFIRFHTSLSADHKPILLLSWTKKVIPPIYLHALSILCQAVLALLVFYLAPVQFQQLLCEDVDSLRMAKS